MRKFALPVTVGTLVVGIFGAFFRWLQDLNAFEQGTGLPVPHAGTTTVFLVYSLIAAAALAGAVLVWLRGCEKPAAIEGALRCRSALPSVIGWICGGLIVLAAAVMLFSARGARFPRFQQVFGAAGIIAGLCFPQIVMKKDAEKQAPLGRAAGVYLSLFYCLWLTFCYRTYSEDPVIWGFAVEILAVAAAAAAFYYIAIAMYGRSRGDRAMLAGALAIYLNIAGLFDQRSTAITVMMAATAGILLLMEYLILCNLPAPGQTAAPAETEKTE